MSKYDHAEHCIPNDPPPKPYELFAYKAGSVRSGNWEWAIGYYPGKMLRDQPPSQLLTLNPYSTRHFTITDGGELAKRIASALNKEFQQ